ncbi:MAG: sugar porter family MFS transporter [Cyanobacteria bacterium]|nr:sugar porter family MFS transporter [Cyanobacteriota bacterium]
MAISFKTYTALVAALGGLLFGYDTGVIAGALVYMEPVFHLETVNSGWLMGWVVSCALLGSMLGALFSGKASDTWGRRPVLIASAILFALSAVGCALPRDIFGFITARIIMGIAIGVASVVTPMMIAEISPEAERGRLVMLNQLAIVSGFLLVYFVNAEIAAILSSVGETANAWRWMFGCSLLPALLFALLLGGIPESPRFLVKQSKFIPEKLVEAQSVLLKILQNECQADRQLAEIQQSLLDTNGQKQVNWGAVIFTRTMLIACILAVLNQLCGINAVMYYGPKIFSRAGMGDTGALNATVWVGFVNLLFTVISMFLIDRVGRRPLLAWGSIGMALSMGVLGASFLPECALPIWVLLTALLSFIACFALSMGAVVWVIISEIFPNHSRGRAVSVATMVLWLFTFIVSQTFPMLMASIGPAMTFWGYGSMSLLTLLFVWKLLPETNGQSLEEA